MARTAAKRPPKAGPGADSNKLGVWSALLLFIACVPLVVQLGMLISFSVFPLQPFQTPTGTSGLGKADTNPASQTASTVKPDTGSLDDCVISFADIHGDLSQARAALSFAGVSNETHLWAAGKCTFIQTGDLVDRGQHSIEVTQLFEDVKKAAEEAGGRVVLLLGNHEMMNLQGDFRYIAQVELRRIGDAAMQHAKLSDLLVAVPEAYRQGVLIYRGSPAFPGAAVWGKLMGAGGALGDAVRRKRIAAVAGAGSCRTLFVHAGMLPAMMKVTGGMYAEGALERFNEEILSIVTDCNGTVPCPPRSTPRRLADLISIDGPLWTRDVSEGAEGKICRDVDALLHAVGAERMVVGHTIQERAQTRCGGQVVLMDVGMCTDIAGSLAAFSCINGHLSIRQK
eukprot:jgi/Ulvmu1/8499/UM044_0033.1